MIDRLIQPISVQSQTQLHNLLSDSLFWFYHSRYTLFDRYWACTSSSGILFQGIYERRSKHFVQQKRKEQKRIYETLVTPARRTIASITAHCSAVAAPAYTAMVRAAASSILWIINKWSNQKKQSKRNQTKNKYFFHNIILKK